MNRSKRFAKRLRLLKRQRKQIQRAVIIPLQASHPAPTVSVNSANWQTLPDGLSYTACILAGKGASERWGKNLSEIAAILGPASETRVTLHPIAQSEHTRGGWQIRIATTKEGTASTIEAITHDWKSLVAVTQRLPLQGAEIFTGQTPRGVVSPEYPS